MYPSVDLTLVLRHHTGYMVLDDTGQGTGITDLGNP